jgi:hypothetical protein
MGEEVLLDSLGLDVTGIMFHDHLSREHLKSTNLSSHTVMAPSLLSSSLSRARSCPRSSMATACEGDGALHYSKSRDWHQDNEACLGKHSHELKTHLADGVA